MKVTTLGMLGKHCPPAWAIVLHRPALDGQVHYYGCRVAHRHLLNDIVGNVPNYFVRFIESYHDSLEELREAAARLPSRYLLAPGAWSAVGGESGKGFSLADSSQYRADQDDTVVLGDWAEENLSYSQCGYYDG